MKNFMAQQPTKAYYTITYNLMVAEITNANAEILTLNSRLC